MSARYFPAALLVLAALAAPSVHGAGQSSTNFSIPRDSVNSGAANSSSANYSLGSTVGEAVLSTQTTSTNNRIDAGFRAQLAVNGPVMTLSPTTLNLGSNPVGIPAAALNVTVGNQGTSSLTLSAITITGTQPADFVRTGTCTPASTLQPATTCTITITFTPGGVGARSATLSVTGNDATNPTQTVNLTGTGLSSNPAVNVTVSGSGSISSSPAGITCPGACSASFANGSAVVLTASPTVGSILQAFAGCDATSGLTCTVSPLNASRNVTATFVTSAATPPDAPVIGTPIAGNGQATINFTPPAVNGGIPILGYTASCTPGPFRANGSASPITVTGLANGTGYSCSVIAINGAGASAPSANVSVTPAQSSLTLQRVFSRKFHGPAAYEIDIDPMGGMTGFVTVEPRAIGAGHSIVFEFNAAITNPGGASAVDANANSMGVASTAASGNSVVVSLTGVPDNKRVLVSVFGVNANANASAAVGFLVGDVTGSRGVNAADISAVKARASPTVGAGNFRYDLNANGAITATDVSAVKARSGLILP